MNKNMSPFQLIILAVFGMLAMIGVVFFALGSAFGTNDAQTGEVLIWGSLEPAPFTSVIQTLAEDDPRFSQVRYSYHPASSFYEDLADAIASGRGPDLIVLADDYMVRHAGKLMPIEYSYISQQTFQDTFISQGDMLLRGEGVYGVPLVVDPLVLYWNKDILASKGYAKPPKYWDELYAFAEKVTERDQTRAITLSGVPLGEYQNVNHAKDIVATLIMQAGGTLVRYDQQGRLVPSLVSRTEEAVQPAPSALRFFTEFANPTKTVYSWNRALPASRDAFAAGNTALYIGYASELENLRSQNPNLAMGVAPLPQINGKNTLLTMGRLYSFAIPRGSLNPAGARTISFLLANAASSRALSERLGLPSAHRDVLAENLKAVNVTPEQAVFNQSALIAESWLDPDPAATEVVFKDMIEGVTSGADKVADAVADADKALVQLLNI
jgi:ABC-type glycerol-3-phosphate transport system substrate-binding protein